jgi:predicted nucleotide-binding protein
MNTAYLRSLSCAVEEFVAALRSLLELHVANTGTPTMRAFMPAVFPRESADPAEIDKRKALVSKAAGKAARAAPVTGCYIGSSAVPQPIDPIATWATITQPKPLLDPENIFDSCAQMLGRLEAMIMEADLQAPATTSTTERTEHPVSASPIDLNRDPSVFLGSSTEGLRVAEAMQSLLDHDFEPEIWNQGTFDANNISLLSLVNATRQFDFAIFIVDVADVATMRGAQKNIARDNVIFELGLFIGAIGAERCFMVYDRNNRPDLPTDLAGVNAVDYRVFQNGNLTGSLGAAATSIKNKIKAVGPRSTPMEVPLPSGASSTAVVLDDVIKSATEPATQPSNKEPAEASTPFYVRKMKASENEYIVKTVRTVDQLLSTDTKLGQLYEREHHPVSSRTPSEITLQLRNGSRVFIDISARWLDHDIDTIIGSFRSRFQMLETVSGGRLGGYLFVCKAIREEDREELAQWFRDDDSVRGQLHIVEYVDDPEPIRRALLSLRSDH